MYPFPSGNRKLGSSKPSEPRPPCAPIDEGVRAPSGGVRCGLAERTATRASIRGGLGEDPEGANALEECPPLWWADKLLWGGLRWFYEMRQCREEEALNELTQGG